MQLWCVSSSNMCVTCARTYISTERLVYTVQVAARTKRVHHSIQQWTVLKVSIHLIAQGSCSIVIVTSSY